MNRIASITLLAVFVLGFSTPFEGQAATIIYGPRPIPREFKSWSLFLICNPGWVVAEKDQQVSKLYDRFLGFGWAIGRENSAVWFWKRESPTISAQNVDVERSARFCKAYNLKPSRSPYLLITTTYPTEDSAMSKVDHAIFELGKMTPEEVTDLLAKLTDDLLLKGRVQTQVPAPGPSIYARVVDELLSSAQSLNCKWSLKLITPLLTAESRPCEKR